MWHHDINLWDYSIVANCGTTAFIATCGTKAFVATCGTKAFVATCGTTEFIATCGNITFVTTCGNLTFVTTCGTTAVIAHFRNMLKVQFLCRHVKPQIVNVRLINLNKLDRIKHKLNYMIPNPEIVNVGFRNARNPRIPSLNYEQLFFFKNTLVNFGMLYFQQ